MIIESTIQYQNGDFVWFHEICETGIGTVGDVIKRADLVELIKRVGGCDRVEIYRREDHSVCLLVVFEDFAMFDSVKDICNLFGHNPLRCGLNFFAIDERLVQVRISLFDGDDIPF